jgi:hypothetical protein
MPPIPSREDGAEGGHSFSGDQPPNPGPVPSNDDVEEHSYDLTAIAPDRVDPRHGPQKKMPPTLFIS